MPGGGAQSDVLLSMWRHRGSKLNVFTWLTDHTCPGYRYRPWVPTQGTRPGTRLAHEVFELTISEIVSIQISAQASVGVEFV